jgi:hypothetical protein
MEDPNNPDRFPPVENDNYRPRPVYDPTGRPKIIVGDAARPASPHALHLTLPMVSTVVLAVAMIAVGVWLLIGKITP